jgi:LuxR family transcriptional regulator, maltose regulon positive regulatory protein
MRPDLVERVDLVNSIRTSPLPVVMVCAPAGYGKTTLLTQSAAALGERVAWVSLDETDNDPVLLLTEIATALSKIMPIDPLVLQNLVAPEPAIRAQVLPRLLNDLAHAPALVLMLDDVHAVCAREGTEALNMLCEYLPVGTRLVLSAREAPALPLPRLRAHGLLLEIGPTELALTAHEAHTLLDMLHVDLEADAFDVLYERTEGWAAGVYLAAVTARTTANPSRTVREFGGDDRSIFEYLSSELLARQSEDRLQFLLRTSVLDRFSASLCDAVLGRDDSSSVIAELEHSTGFLVALDSHREWYRYHNLFADVLQSTLAKVEPGLAPTLHDRASRWHERHGSAADAIEHAIASADRRRAAELLASNIHGLFNSGRHATIRRWIKAFSDADLADYPPLAAGAAWVMGQMGERALTRRYISLLERATSNGPFPLGESSSQSAVALLKAAFGWEGVNQMRALAEIAYRLEPTGTEAHQRAALYLGANMLLRGRFDAAQELLEEAATIGESGANSANFACGLLALVHLEAQRLPAAEACLDEGLGLVEQLQLQSYANSGAVFVARAWLELERGERAEAAAWLDRALELLPTAITKPWWFILLAIVSSRVALALGEAPRAESLLAQAQRELARYPDCGMLPHWLTREQRALEAAHGGAGVLREPLTEAELRVLDLAPTHLTLEEIGRNLCISRNTVKTHLKVIYSKLNVASRGEAVDRAQAIGLIGRRTTASAVGP